MRRVEVNRIVFRGVFGYNHRTDMSAGGHNPSDLQKRIHEIIFEADTPAGRRFDLLLIIFILLSVFAMWWETTPGISPGTKTALHKAEWAFTIVFTIEYVMRLWCVKSPRMYAFSFWGIIDLLAILPSYLSLFIPGAEYMLLIRSVRVLRIFRVLGMNSHVSGLNTIVEALVRNSKKIFVFLIAILVLVSIFGAVMFFIEGQPVRVENPATLSQGQLVWTGESVARQEAMVTQVASGVVTIEPIGGTARTLEPDEPVYRPFNDQFESIPKSVYWAIVTLTTVGYGDISPITPAGRTVAALVMILGYSILGVAIGGIVSTEMSESGKLGNIERECGNCNAQGHAFDARRCYVCGHELPKTANIKHALNTARSCINCGAEGHRLDAQRCHRCGDELGEQEIESYKQLFEMDVESDDSERSDKDQA